MTNTEFYPGAIDAGGCVSEGWNLIKPNYWMYFGITFLIILASIVLSRIPVVPIVFQIFVMSPVWVGVYYVLLHAMRGEAVDFGMFFKGFDKFVPAMLVGLIRSIPLIIFTIFSLALNLSDVFTQIIQQSIKGGRSNLIQPDNATPLFAGGIIIALIIGAIVYLLFSIVWGITFFFAVPILADKDIGAMDAIKLSARAGWSNVGGIIVLAIFESLIAFVGVIALCIGVLFAMPVIYAANAFAYRQVFPMIQQQFNMSPPPPTAYSSDFGSGM